MRYILTIGLILAFSELSAQQVVRWTNRDFTEEDMNKFRFHGGAIACITNEIQNPKRGYLECLHISDIRMNMSIKEVEERYGKPYKEIDNGNSQSRIYLLPTDGQQYPYLVITYVKGVVDAIQLTGHETTKAIDFASIKLGDNEEFVKEMLGPPSEIHDVKEIKGIMWSYDPFPISIEFIDRKVYSIRIQNNMKN